MNQKQKMSCCKLGAYSAIIAGISFLVIAILAFQMPPSIASYVASQTYFEEFQSIAGLFQTLKTLMIISNIAMIGVVCAFLSLCREENTGLVLWSSILAFLGFGFGIYQNVVDMSVIPNLTQQYLVKPLFIQDIILVLGISNTKLFIITLGLPGIWFLVVSLLASSNQYIPKFLIYLGVLWVN